MALSRQNEMALIREAQQGNAAAREACIRAFDDLIQFIAKGFLGHGLELDDLIQEGRLCLHRVLDRYLPEKSAPRTFFKQRLEWHFIQYKSVWLGLRDEARKGWPKVLKAVETLKHEGVEEPPVDAIAERSGVRPEIVAEILAVQRGREVPFSVENDISASGEDDMHDVAQPSAEALAVQADEVLEQFQPLVDALAEDAGPFLALSILREGDVYTYTWQEIATLLADGTTSPANWQETVATDYAHLPVSLIEWASVSHYFAARPALCTAAALRQWYRRQRVGISPSSAVPLGGGKSR